ncbi:kelch-like protein 25 [Rhinoraja longicauda]
MSVSEHENRKSRSQGPTNTSLFQKASHPESVLSQLDNLRRQCLFTDVTLRAGSRSFPCHRAVLAACSRYFEAMFSSGLRESRAGEVDFGESVQPEALEQLLEYAYTSRLALSGDNAESLLQAGDMLQLHDVRQAAADFLERSLSADNCLRLMLLADAHQCRCLYQQAWGMCLAHFETYADGGVDGNDDDDFCGLPEAKLGELLACDELEADDERLVHRALMRWVRHDADARRHCLPRLLGHVRLGLLPAGYLERTVARDGLVVADERSLRLVAEARRCQLLPSSSPSPSPCARPRRAGHTLLILGGRTFMCDKVYELERRARRIVPRAALPSPRKEFSACALGAKVYVSGGRGSETGVSRDVWVLDTAAGGGWARAAPMLLARFGHGSAELLGSLYVVGGHTSAVPTGDGGGGQAASPSVERYEPRADAWRMVAPLHDGVSNAAVVSARRRLFVIGGAGAGPRRGHEHERERAPNVQRYDPDDDHWTVAAACPQAWRYTAAAAVLGSQIFIMGGDTEFTAASAYRFDCDTNEWSRLGDMSAKRMSCHAVASGNKLYVVGGYFGTQRCKSLDCYDPTSDTWSSITTVPYSLIPTAFVSTWKHRDLLDTD